MQFLISNTQPEEFIKTLAESLNVKVQNECVEQRLVFNAEVGEGQINSFSFSGGIGMVVLYCTLKEDWELVIAPSTPALQFNFCASGEIRHFLQDHEIQYQLAPLQGSITANRTGTKEYFFLPAHTELIFTYLVIDREKYLQRIDCLVDEMPPELATAFKDQEGEKAFLYQSNYSLSIAELIKCIIKDKNEGMIRSAFVEGKTLELLSKQIKQFSDDLQLPEKQAILRESDVANIKAARDILIRNLQAPPTIEELARQTGINRQKLKSGFKVVFDKTINAYLREHRLEAAAALLLSGQSVTETAREIGYVNSAHFARLFKDKYGVFPKDYRKTIQNRMKTK